MDWRALFVPDVPVLEILLRGSLMYLFLFVLLRVVLKRESGGISITDVLMVVLLADAAQNAMAGTYNSITDGMILVATIVFWSFFLDWMAHRSPAFRRLIQPKALLLVEHGRMLRRNMAKEMITEEDLMSQVRQAGVEDLAQVERVYIEGDGKFSVIRKDEGEVQKKKESPAH